MWGVLFTQQEFACKLWMQLNESFFPHSYEEGRVQFLLPARTKHWEEQVTTLGKGNLLQAPLRAAEEPQSSTTGTAKSQRVTRPFQTSRIKDTHCPCPPGYPGQNSYTQLTVWTNPAWLGLGVTQHRSKLSLAKWNMSPFCSGVQHITAPTTGFSWNSNKILSLEIMSCKEFLPGWQAGSMDSYF